MTGTAGCRTTWTDDLVVRAINLSIGDNLSGGDPGLRHRRDWSNGDFTFARYDVSSSGYIRWYPLRLRRVPSAKTTVIASRNFSVS